jgi:hypothetical protein
MYGMGYLEDRTSRTSRAARGRVDGAMCSEVLPCVPRGPS